MVLRGSNDYVKWEVVMSSFVIAPASRYLKLSDVVHEVVVESPYPYFMFHNLSIPLLNL